MLKYHVKMLNIKFHSHLTAFFCFWLTVHLVLLSIMRLSQVEYAWSISFGIALGLLVVSFWLITEVVASWLQFFNRHR